MNNIDINIVNNEALKSFFSNYENILVIDFSADTYSFATKPKWAASLKDSGPLKDLAKASKEKLDYLPDDLASFLSPSRLRGIKKNETQKKLFESEGGDGVQYFELTIWPTTFEKGLVSQLLILSRDFTSDVTASSAREVSSLRSELANDKLSNGSFKGFDESWDYEKSLQYLLESIGSYYHANRSALFCFKGSLITPVSEWKNKKEKIGKSFPKELDIHIFDFAYPSFNSHVPAFFLDPISLKAKYPRSYEFFRSRETKQAIFAPIFIGNTIYGFIGLRGVKADNYEGLSYLLQGIANRLALYISECKNKEEQNRDALTGVYSMPHFSFLAESALRTPAERSYFLIKFDIVRFKMINAYYGFPKGSDLLRSVAEYLKNNPRLKVLARQANTDIFYALADSTEESIIKVMRSMADDIQRLYSSVPFMMSFGAYECKKGYESFLSIDSKVSLAHANAKRSRSGNIVFYDEALEASVILEQDILANFNSALSSGAFQIVIQPKFDMSQKKYIGGEALVRWSLHDKTVSPGVFIPVLERASKVSSLDMFVLSKTCEAIKAGLSSPNAVPISVNFSRVDFYDDNFFNKVLSIIDSYHVPHNLIEFEITESAYIELEEVLIKFVAACNSAGFKVLMDDFGTGYSSLNSLKDLNISILKVDYHFLLLSKDKERRNAIIRSTVSLCRELEIPIVVEGVERGEDVTFLRSIGVRYIQGYYFGKPMSVDQFMKLRNRSLPLTTPSKTSLTLEEVEKSESPLSTFIFNSLTAIGLFTYDGNSLKMMKQNEVLSECRFSVRHSFFIGQANIFDFIPKSDLPTLKAYFSALVSGKTTVGSASFRLADEVEELTLMCRGHYIGERLTKPVLLLEFFLKQSLTGKPNDKKDYGYDDFKTLFNSLFEGVVVYDSNLKVLYFNQSALESYHSLTIGSPIREGIFHDDESSKLPTGDTPKREVFFSRRDKCFVGLSSIPVTVLGQDAIILTFTKNLKGVDVGDTKTKRMLSAIENELSGYMEINLGTGAYEKCEFNFSSFDIPSEGDFKLAYQDIIDNQIDDTYREEAKRRFALDALRLAADKDQPFNLRMKVAKTGIYIQDSVSFAHDHEGDFACIIIKDVTEEVMKDFDSLSGLLNRNTGKLAINSYLVENSSSNAYFALIDINSFKEINDTYGHPIGDQVIVSLSEIMGNLEVASFVTRLGGDEFVFLIKNPKTDFSLEKFRSNFQSSFKKIGAKMGMRVPTEISVGFAKFPDDGVTFDSLYASADTRMYVEKKKEKIHRK